MTCQGSDEVVTPSHYSEDAEYSLLGSTGGSDWTGDLIFSARTPHLPTHMREAVLGSCGLALCASWLLLCFRRVI